MSVIDRRDRVRLENARINCVCKKCSVCKGKVPYKKEKSTKSPSLFEAIFSIVFKRKIPATIKEIETFGGCGRCGNPRLRCDKFCSQWSEK